MRTNSPEQIRVDIVPETETACIARRGEGPALENLLDYLSDSECLTVLQWAKRCAPHLLRRLMVCYFESKRSEVLFEPCDRNPPVVEGSPTAVGSASPESVTLEAAEREHITRVLSESKNLTEAAAKLGIHSTTLWRKLKRYRGGTL